MHGRLENARSSRSISILSLSIDRRETLERSVWVGKDLGFFISFDGLRARVPAGDSALRIEHSVRPKAATVPAPPPLPCSAAR